MASKIILFSVGSSIEAEKFAEKLDERINSLGLVKMYCQQRSLHLSLPLSKTHIK
jgi:hypothetical protein